MQEKNVKIVVFGCRLNSFEAEKMKIIAESVVSKPTIIVNTCAVTNMAVKQAKQEIRKLAKKYPDYDIIVAGCASTANPDEFSKMPNVVKILGNKEKFNPSAYKSDNLIEAKTLEFAEKLPLFIDNQSLLVKHFEKLTKGFVQIQQGCNNCCSFCLVRKLRGMSVSFPYEHIKRQVEILIENGYKEIVLTGVDIASYSDKDGGIIELIQKLLKDVSGIQRLMLSSLDPAKDWKPLVDLINNDSRLMAHIHLSMQSGSDTILKSMNRRHNVQQVIDLMNYAKKQSRTISFGWDIICGFPGETEELFQETVNLIQKLQPTHLHVFPFSKRPNTVAEKLPNQISRGLAKNRTNQLIDLGQKNMLSYMKNMVGKTASVLIESNNSGYTDDYIFVKLKKHSKKGEILNTKLIEIENSIPFKMIAE